jgi:hypothetical protein
LRLSLFIFLTILFCNNLFGQQNVSISDVSVLPDPSSVLDVSSTSKGLLVPRMTSAQRSAINNPANGLIVYDTDNNCIYFYNANNNTWNSLCNSTTNSSNLIANTTTVNSGVNCANGGILLELGNDLNNNGILEFGEISNSDYICNGQAGISGPQGAQGLQGLNGINCWDFNANGINDTSEDTNADGNFNGLDCIGAQGPAGVAGPQGVAGAQGAVGPPGPQGIQGPPVTANFYGVYATRTNITTSYPNFTQVSGLTQTVNITTVPAKIFISTTGNLETWSTQALGSGCVVQLFQNNTGIPQMFQVVDVNNAQNVFGTIGIWSITGYVNITTPGTYTFSVKACKYAFDSFYAGGNSTAPAGLQNHGSLILQVFY